MMIQKFIDGEKLFQGDQECGYLQIEDKMKKVLFEKSSPVSLFSFVPKNI